MPLGVGAAHDLARTVRTSAVLIGTSGFFVVRTGDGGAVLSSGAGSGSRSVSSASSSIGHVTTILSPDGAASALGECARPAGRRSRPAAGRPRCGADDGRDRAAAHGPTPRPRAAAGTTRRRPVPRRRSSARSNHLTSTLATTARHGAAQGAAHEVCGGRDDVGMAVLQREERGPAVAARARVALEDQIVGVLLLGSTERGQGSLDHQHDGLDRQLAQVDAGVAQPVVEGAQHAMVTAGDEQPGNARRPR